MTRAAEEVYIIPVRVGCLNYSVNFQSTYSIVLMGKFIDLVNIFFGGAPNMITSGTMAAFTTNASFGKCAKAVNAGQPGSGCVSTCSVALKTAIIIYFLIARMIVYLAVILSAIKIKLIMPDSSITK